MIPAIHLMNLRTLDLNLLLVFEALMDERNVTRAGQPKEGSGDYQKPGEILVAIG